MATSYTLDTLKSDLEAFLGNYDSDFETTNLPQLIKVAEDKCLLDLNVTLFDVTGNVAIEQSTATATLPPDWIRLLTLEITVSGARQQLEQRTYDYCRDYWPSTTAEDVPLYWAPYTDTAIYLAPTPNAAYTAAGRGVMRPGSLVDNEEGTWLSKYCGSLLLHACLVVTEQFEIADERIEMWKKEYAEDLDARRLELRHLIRHDYDLPPMPAPQQAQEQGT